MCFAPQRRAIFRHRTFKNWSEPVSFLTFWLAKCAFRYSRVPFLNISNCQNRLRECGVLCILTSKCASRHSGVQFFDIGTSKSGSDDRQSFYAFSLANVLRATAACHFSNIATSKMAPTNVVFCTFWLANVLRATAACHFSPVCQNSYLRTRRFSEATFRTSGTTNHWKNTAIRDVPNIFHTCTFFLVTLHACVSPFCWLDICCLFDTSTLLFNSAYCRKLDF